MSETRPDTYYNRQLGEEESETAETRTARRDRMQGDALRAILSRTFNTPLDLPPGSSYPYGRPDHHPRPPLFHRAASVPLPNPGLYPHPATAQGKTRTADLNTMRQCQSPPAHRPQHRHHSPRRHQSPHRHPSSSAAPSHPMHSQSFSASHTGSSRMLFHGQEGRMSPQPNVRPGSPQETAFRNPRSPLHAVSRHQTSSSGIMHSVSAQQPPGVMSSLHGLQSALDYLTWASNNHYKQARMTNQEDKQKPEFFNPAMNYATYPISKTYSAADSVFAGSNHSTAPDPAAGSGEEKRHVTYATIPPMNSSVYGWAQTRRHLAHEAERSAKVEHRQNHDSQETVGAETSSQHDHVKFFLRKSEMASTMTDSSGRDQYLHPHMRQRSESDASNVTGSSECSSCQGNQCNTPWQLPLPPMDDFLLQRFLEEATTFQSMFQPPGPSPFQPQPVPSFFPPESFFPPQPSMLPTYSPFMPFSPPLLPPTTRNSPVHFSPVGRHLYNMLKTPHRDEMKHPSESPSQMMNTFMSLLTKLTCARSGQESWKAINRILAFQARCLAPEDSAGAVKSQCTGVGCQNAECLDPSHCPIIPVQAGQSEDIMHDFSLFCVAFQAALTPPFL